VFFLGGLVLRLLFYFFYGLAVCGFSGLSFLTNWVWDVCCFFVFWNVLVSVALAGTRGWKDLYCTVPAVCDARWAGAINVIHHVIEPLFVLAPGTARNSAAAKPTGASSSRCPSPRAPALHSFRGHVPGVAARTNDPSRLSSTWGDIPGWCRTHLLSNCTDQIFAAIIDTARN